MACSLCEAVSLLEEIIKNFSPEAPDIKKIRFFATKVQVVPVKGRSYISIPGLLSCIKGCEIHGCADSWGNLLESIEALNAPGVLDLIFLPDEVNQKHFGRLM